MFKVGDMVRCVGNFEGLGVGVIVAPDTYAKQEDNVYAMYSVRTFLSPDTEFALFSDEIEHITP